MIDYYIWVRAFHIIAIVSWMAGLLYLPRLFVYHRDVEPNSEAAQLFQTMEKRLFYIIMVPSMGFSLASGFFLAMISNVWSSGWLHLKLFFVVGLVVYQYLLNNWRLALANGTCVRSSKFFRIINELPFLLLVCIVICVVVKPF